MKHLFRNKKAMTTTIKSFNLIHEVYERQESGEFDTEWGYGEEPELDKAEFRAALHFAFEDFCNDLNTIFNKIGVCCEVFSGDETKCHDKEMFVIDLYVDSSESQVGYILPTETGFMWMKEGFDSVNLPDLQSIIDFVEFLGNTRYRWIKMIESGESRLIGFDNKNYSKFAWPWVQKGFIRPRNNYNGFAYCSIGNPDKCDM